MSGDTALPPQLDAAFRVIHEAVDYIRHMPPGRDQQAMIKALATQLDVYSKMVTGLRHDAIPPMVEDEGLSYAQAGERLGVTKQYVGKIVRPGGRHRGRDLDAAPPTQAGYGLLAAPVAPEDTGTD